MAESVSQRARELNAKLNCFLEVFEEPKATHSGKLYNLNEISEELSRRLSAIFLRDEKGMRPVFGQCEKMQTDPHFKDYLLFHEYFHGDSGKGLGASHQTGWTGLVAKLLLPRKMTPTPSAPGHS